MNVRHRFPHVRARHLVIGIAAVVASLVPLACGDDDSGGSPTTQAAATITIENFAFTVLPAKAGTITINNKDSADHTVTSDDGTSFSVTVPGNSTGTIQVGNAGTYTFHCNIHTTMTGELVVT